MIRRLAAAAALLAVAAALILLARDTWRWERAVHDADARTTEQMQTITREFNLSETIFVLKPQDPNNTARVRIFFPGGEMPFAGHPTLGCAILLAEMKHKPGCSFEHHCSAYIIVDGFNLLIGKTQRFKQAPFKIVVLFGYESQTL